MYGTKQAGKDDIAFTLASVKDQETTNKGSNRAIKKAISNRFF